MRKELYCPQIIEDGKIIGYGGNQEWFPGDFQRLAGCGSVTGSNIAAIYALSREDFKDLYPFETEHDATDYEQYLNLMQTMFRYMKPALKEDHPVAFLILRHPAYELREDNWHWVTITGFDEEEEKLIWSNCGEREEIDWNMLFDTEKKYYVGIVRFKEV